MTAARPRILHISTTRKLGGVSEVIRSELPYLAEAGWDAEWIAANDIGASHDAAFVLHNALYGVPSPEFPRDVVDTGVADYIAVNTQAVVAAARTADVVVLHDAMVLMLAGVLRPVVPTIAWRCHVGCEQLDLVDPRAVEYVRPSLDLVDHLLFSHRKLIWPGWEHDPRITVVPPGIDPRSWKNRDLGEEAYAAVWPILSAAGSAAAPPECATGDADDAYIAVADHGTGGLTDPDAPFVLQVSRWDPLKGQIGVLRGFAELAREETDLELILVGPHINDVENYPVNRRIWQELMDVRAALPEQVRRRVHVWRFGPIQRTGEDIALNTLRRRARTVVQNSRRESFGLTVAEAMWQGAVVVGADVDGISEQITHGVNGLLTPFTLGDGSWAEAVRRSVRDEAGRADWSGQAHRTVRDRFLSHTGVSQQLTAYGKVPSTVDAEATPAG